MFLALVYPIFILPRYSIKACQRLLVLNAVTAQVRLANNAIKASPGFSIFGPGDLHTIKLEDFPPSATHAPLSLLPLLQDAGWNDEDSSSRPVVVRASAGRPGPQGQLPGAVSAGPP